MNKKPNDRRCSASDCGDFVYMFVLHLQDESGSLDAIVYGRDAV